MEDKNMNFPLKNKEALDPKDTYVVSKAKYRIALITAVLSTLTTIIGVVVPAVKEVMVSEDKKMLQKVKEEKKLDAFKDSIFQLEAIRTQKRTYRNISKMNELMDELRKALPKSAHISLYYTHDSGGVPVSGSQLNVTILQSENNSEPCLGKAYWQDKAIPEGYFNWNHRLFESRSGFAYASNLTEDKKIFITETAEDLKCNGVNALMGIVVKKTAFAVYYITAAWTEPEPHLNNSRASITLRKYADMIEPLIEGKKRTL